jgi:hypothetical protein
MAAYRITVEALDPALGEGGLESLSFFASTGYDLFAEANQLRCRLDCSSCQATRLAIARCLLAEESAVPHPSSSLVIRTGA